MTGLPQRERVLSAPEIARMQIMAKKKKKRRVPAFVTKFGALLAAKGIQAWMGTLDYRAVFYDRSVDPVLGIGGSRIYIFWHENILIPLYLRGHCNLAMLLSQHTDAEVLSHVAYHMGFDCVRGSTYRGGAKAIWELTERSRRQHLTITPDGPRGPRRHLAMGPIYLASRLQLPLVVMGFGYDRPWRMNSWDRFAVPRPFSRARAIIGPPMMLPADLDRAGLERCRLRAEALLNCLNCEAEAWAASGTRKIGEFTMVPQAAPPQPQIEIIPQRIPIAAAARAA
jgi:lysophospholipid acyltransferase (LPLAT)-like uncharacterized protein